MKHLFPIFLFCVLFSSSIFAQKSEKIDEFSTLPCDDHIARMDYVISESQKTPSATVYVFVYEGKVKTYSYETKKEKFILPARGSVKAKIASMKKYIAVRKFSVEKFKFVDAGFREEATVEFWLVPNGAKPPEPTSTLKEMKYRKGKAKGFCVSCCSI